LDNKCSSLANMQADYNSFVVLVTFSPLSIYFLHFYHLLSVFNS
jgi:hypothetical protein